MENLTSFEKFQSALREFVRFLNDLEINRSRDLKYEDASKDVRDVLYESSIDEADGV